jgi:hypothetical protein
MFAARFLATFLQWSYRGRAGSFAAATLLPFVDRVLDLLTFGEVIEGLPLHRRMVEENVLRAFALNETESLVLHDFLDLPSRHTLRLPKQLVLARDNEVAKPTGSGCYHITLIWWMNPLGWFSRRAFFRIGSGLVAVRDVQAPGLKAFRSYATIESLPLRCASDKSAQKKIACQLL